MRWMKASHYYVDGNVVLGCMYTREVRRSMDKLQTQSVDMSVVAVIFVDFHAHIEEEQSPPVVSEEEFP